jgi:hypothetical protein
MAVNLVGTGIRNCSSAADPNDCYSNPYVLADLVHIGPSWVPDYDGQMRRLDLASARIEGLKALAGEEYADPVSNGFNQPWFAAITRSEIAARPFDGSYRIILRVTPDVQLGRITAIQILQGQTYWVKQN